jgi:SAM-dependent methyltransferase
MTGTEPPSEDEDRVALVAGLFSEDAPLYERHWAASMARLGRRLLDDLPLADARTVVDIGAGVGALLPAIREATPSAFVAGVDAAEGMIRRAPPHFGRAVMDAGRLAIRDSSVDAAVMPFMLFFLPDPSRGLREVHRILRPGGGLGVSTWAAGVNDFRADDVWASVLDEHGAPPARSWGLDLLDTPEKLERLLEEAGFAHVRSGGGAEPEPMSLDEFLEVRTSIGRSKRRFESLPPEVRSSVLKSARERLSGLPPEDLTDPQVAVFAWGTKPSDLMSRADRERQRLADLGPDPLGQLPGEVSKRLGRR